MRGRLLLAGGLLLAGAHVASAQGAPRITPGWGVDTAAAAWSEIGWHGDVSAIFGAWRDFLGARPGTPGADTLWSTAERRAWPAYDLASATGYRGFPATVLDIRPAGPAQRDTFMVRTLFAAAIGPDHDVKPAALTRVYALRDHGHWRFANALPRLTAGWSRVRIGPITYVFSPAHRFDRARAERAIRFADSLAAAFGVPKIDSLTYYVADDPESLFRVMGVDWSFGGQGYGYAIRADHLLLTGDPDFAEANLHELTHYVLSPLVKQGRTHPLIGEGVASWLGGSMGMPFPRMMRAYAAFLRAHPRITLDSVLAEQGGPDLGERPAGAMLARMVFGRQGVPGVKSLLDSGARDEDLRRTVEGLLAVPWPRIAAEWRRRIEAFGSAAESPLQGGPLP